MSRLILILICSTFIISCASTSQTIKGFSTSHPQAEQQKINAVFTTPKRIAVLIGINKFDDRHWGDLRYATKDAHDLSAVLNDTRYGNFDTVITLTESGSTTKQAIIDSVDKIARYNISTDDTVVFFISSHGTLARPSDGKLHQYIVAGDTRFDDVPGTAIDVVELKKSIGALKSEKKVMILAFCHSGQGKSRLNDGILTELSGIKAPFFVKPIEDASEATIVLAASAWGETAREDRTLQNDIYTHFLIDGIKKNDRNGDGAVTVTEAHDYAKEQTYYLTKGEQRPSMESIILGTDPIILAGEIKRKGKPVLYDYTHHYEDMVVTVDGEAKGTLPLGIALEPGVHKVSLASNENDKPLYSEIFEINDGEQLSLPILLHGYDHGTSFKIGYQGFLTEKVDRSISKPLVMYGISYAQPGYFSPRFGFRADFSFGKDKQVLDLGAVTAEADVSQVNAGVAYLYRNEIGSSSWYTGPRIGVLYISRDSDAINFTRESNNSLTLGGILGWHFNYKKQVSLAVESSLHYANVQISNTDKDALYYNISGSLSVNF